jgi:hypothetical protein
METRIQKVDPKISYLSIIEKVIPVFLKVNAVLPLLVSNQAPILFSFFNRRSSSIKR